VDAAMEALPIRRDSNEDNDAIKAEEVPLSNDSSPIAACLKDLDVISGTSVKFQRKSARNIFSGREVASELSFIICDIP
jgi:hypothetical protein